MKKRKNSGEMKSWMALIPVSAKVRKKQNRMTNLCIVLAVALVCTLFGMADMAIRSQKMQAILTDGNWHAAFKTLSSEQEELLRARTEVEVSSWYDTVNYRLDEGYMLEGVQTVICGTEEEFLNMFPSAQMEEGTFPQSADSAAFSKGVKERLGVKVGDTLELALPDGNLVPLKVSGFLGDTSLLTVTDAFGIFVGREAFSQIAPKEMSERKDGVCYVRFVPHCDIQKTLADIREQFSLPEEQVGQNTRLLGLMGQSRDPFILQLYTVALVLAVLVMVAGILMITGSLNSNIAQRTGFFGMLRCLGATPRQIIRFVRCEALNWCKTAIPIGLMTGVVVVWLLCGLLRALSPSFFGEMPVFGVSFAGMAAGIVLGLVTVLLAAQAPAKKAAKVSPLTAVSGNAGTVYAAKKAAGTRFFPVETALGIHHAKGSKKNFLLLTGSFAFTILLFLGFSATIDFMDHAVTALRPYTPDVSVISLYNTCSVPGTLLGRWEQNPAIKRVYGRRFAYDVPALLDKKEGRVNLVSYEKHQFRWAKKMLLSGTVQKAESGQGVMIEYAYAGENTLREGSRITVSLPGGGTQELEVTAVLSKTPFDRGRDGVENVICSEELFERLTGVTDYTIIDIQLNHTATEADVLQIRREAGEETVFSDRRMSNQEARGAYYCYAVFLYGFLAIIALISAFNIINSIGMSVSAHILQYGAMRAVGMSSRQLVRMVAAEAGTYVCAGIAVGCICGLWLHKFIFEHMVSFRWGDPWYVPVRYVCLITALILLSAVLAVYRPVKQIRKMSIVETLRS